MSYAIDTDGTRGVGSTLLTTGAELRDCGTTVAFAGGLLRTAVGADHPALPAALDDFLTTHLTALEAIAAGCSALARALTWTAQSAHEVELTTAADFGGRGLAAPVDSLGILVG